MVVTRIGKYMFEKTKMFRNFRNEVQYDIKTRGIELQ